METKPEQKQSIFRKKAMERISSPEELDQYLTVTGPGVWFPLITAVVLLIGALVWMTLGSIDVTLNVAIAAGDSGVVCYVPAEHKQAAVKCGSVIIAGTAYTLTDVGLADLALTEESDASVRRAGGLSYAAEVSPLKVNAELMHGVYQGQITVETVNPISYIIN